MDKTMALSAELVLHIHQEIQIAAPAALVFETVLDQAGPAFATPDGKSLAMKLEAWPGGRWFRDLGNNTGHLWGHVQVIKPPTLLELYGPMMMSYAAISHVQYRLTEKDGTTTLALTHRALGQISQEHRDGVTRGWQHIIGTIKKRSER